MAIVGKGIIASLSGGALAQSGTWGTLPSGYVSPNLQSLRVGHQGEVDRIHDQAGDINCLHERGEFLECEFNVIPQGTTIANARTSATIPQLLEAFAISGLPILRVGKFADALNTNATNTQPWFYEGGGTLNGDATGSHWTMTLPLKRYFGITSAAKITA